MTSWFVDNAAGNDANAGTSTSAPFRHCPGGSDFTGTCTLQPGDFVYFKRGVTYLGGLITCGQSGSSIATGSNGTVTVGGVFVSSGATFQSAGVNAGTDLVYIYHNKESVTGTWVESTGLFAVVSVDSETQLTLSGFTGRAWAMGELPYVVIRPITYKAAVGWGDGDATISGNNTIPSLFDVGSQARLRFDGLKIVNTTDTSTRSAAAIKTSGSPSNIYVCNCDFDNTLNAGVYILNCAYSVLSNNTITNFNGWGLALSGTSSIQEHNTITGKGTTDSVRSGLSGNRYSIIRYNTVKDVVGTWGGYHADSIGYIDGGSPNQTNSYGWIYGNKIDNFVEGAALYYTGGGTIGWVLHSNLFICRRDTTTKGDSATLFNGCDGLRLYNNTFVGMDGTSLGTIGSTAVVFEARDVDSKNCDLKNNLFIADAGSAIRFDTTEHTGTTSDYNHVSIAGNVSPFWYEGVSKTFAEWQALGYDVHGLTADPQVVSVAGEDFHLTASSPGRAAGADLSSIFTVDIEGNTRTTTPSIGAYEYDSGSGGDEEIPISYLPISVGSGHLVLGVGA